MRGIGLRLLAILLLALAATPAWAHGLRRADLRIEPAGLPAEMAVAPPAFVRLPDSAARLERIPRRVPVTRSGVDLAEITGVLIVTLGLAGFGRSWRRDRRMAMATVTAALLLGFVVETAPHLVHHALDADKGAGCQVLQTSERSQAAVGTLSATLAPAPACLIDAPSTAPAPTLAAPAARGRAPPA